LAITKRLLQRNRDHILQVIDEEAEELGRRAASPSAQAVIASLLRNREKRSAARQSDPIRVVSAPATAD
jgi:hypothetical protein